MGIGGGAGHVHLLIGLEPTHCLSDVMRDLKKSSSSWVSKTTTKGEGGGLAPLPGCW